MKQNVALVLEGGGFRDMFTAGVTDVMMEEGIWGFSSIWGVSAGAMSAASYKSRQIGRTMRIMLAFRDDPRLMSMWSYITTGNIARADFLYDKVQSTFDPFNGELFNRNPLQMYCVASDVTFGTPAYLHVKSLPEDVESIRASSSLPLFSKMVDVNSHHYLDGGTTDSIPFTQAMGLGGSKPLEGYTPATKAVVVLTRDRNYIKDLGNDGLVLRSHRYDSYPYFIAALEDRYERYNKCRKQLWDLGKKGSCLVIAPAKLVEVGVDESSGEKLLNLYLEGRQQAFKAIKQLREFVPEPDWVPDESITHY